MRDPHSAGYVAAKELPDGAIPPVDVDGNFIIGPTHNADPAMSAQNDVPRGTVIEFTMNSADSKIYSGIARDPNTFGTVDPSDPAKLVVTTSHPAPYTRKVAVYVPKQYVPGAAAPFIVGADGPDGLLFTTLDSLIGSIEVPALALSAPIVADIDAGSLREGVGHIRGTAIPGGLGTVGLAGHRDSFFRPLRRIAPGMEITLTGNTGTYHYVVDSTEIVTPDKVHVLYIAQRPALTLITCFPFDYIGPAPRRFIVHAHLLSAAPDRKLIR